MLSFINVIIILIFDWIMEYVYPIYISCVYISSYTSIKIQVWLNTLTCICCKALELTVSTVLICFFRLLKK